MKIIMLLLIWFSTMNSWAQSNLTLFTEDGEKFVLILNGIQQNMAAASHIKLDNITANVQKMKIVFDSKEIKDISQNIYYEKNQEYTYVIKKKNKKAQMERVGPQAAQSVVFVVKLLDTKPIKPLNQQADLPKIDSVNELESKPLVKQNSTENIQNQDRKTVCHPMPVVVLVDLLKQLKAQSFENNKIKIVKQVLATHCVSTAQVKKIMGEFKFDSNKLKTAKLCYAKATDKSNYFTLNEAFAHSFMAEELNDFIKNNGVLTEEDLED